MLKVIMKRGGRQKSKKKKASNRFNNQNNNCARAFLYISLPTLHDYDVKVPNFTFYRGSTQATTKFLLSF